METTITPGPVPGVLDGIATRRDEYKATADRLAAGLRSGPSMDELTRVEEELLAQLADVRRRKTDRAVAESEHRAAVEAAEFFGGLIGRTRMRIEEAQQGAGLLVDRPRPDPDPLAGPAGIVRDSREEVAAATGGYPTVPAAQVTPPVPSGPSGVAEVGRVVATSGPLETMPDPSAQPVSGPRHKKGGRK